MVEVLCIDAREYWRCTAALVTDASVDGEANQPILETILTVGRMGPGQVNPTTGDGGGSEAGERGRTVVGGGESGCCGH